MKLLISHEDYIESERDKINNGTTINGVHISGLHYFYLNYFYINNKLPAFKESDAEFFKDYINNTSFTFQKREPRIPTLAFNDEFVTMTYNGRPKR